MHVNPFPVGFRFSPTEEELVHYYLKNKVMDCPFHDPTNRFKQLQLYNYTPEKLRETYGVQREVEMYIFVKKVLKHQKGKRLERRIANGSNGYWKASTGEINIKLDGIIVGHRRTLVYYNGERRKTNWLMYEYRLPDHDQTLQLDDWLLCKVYFKGKEENKSTQVHLAEEPVVILNSNRHVEQAKYSSASQAAAEQPTTMVSSNNNILLPNSNQIFPSCFDFITDDELFQEAIFTNADSAMDELLDIDNIVAEDMFFEDLNLWGQA